MSRHRMIHLFNYDSGCVLRPSFGKKNVDYSLRSLPFSDGFYLTFHRRKQDNPSGRGDREEFDLFSR